MIPLEQARAILSDPRIAPEARSIIARGLIDGPKRLPPWDHAAAENRSAERRAALARLLAFAQFHLDEVPPNAHTTNTETKAPREE